MRLTRMTVNDFVAYYVSTTERSRHPTLAALHPRSKPIRTTEALDLQDSTFKLHLKCLIFKPKALKPLHILPPRPAPHMPAQRIATHT